MMHNRYFRDTGDYSTKPNVYSLYFTGLQVDPHLFFIYTYSQLMDILHGEIRSNIQAERMMDTDSDVLEDAGCAISCVLAYPHKYNIHTSPTQFSVHI